MSAARRMKHSYTHLFPLIVCLAVASFLGACQIVGGSRPGGPGPDPSEAGQRVIYQGVFTLDGGDIPAALELDPEGGRSFRGALQASSGLLADGRGRRRGQMLRLELTYGGDCPGRMLLEGEWDRVSGIYQGSIQASDCTGQSEGTFRFSAS